MNLVKSTIASLVCASLLVSMLPLAAAHAAPVAKTTISKESDITLVRRGGRGGWGAGALIGGLIAGGLIAAAISEGRADDRAMRHCAEDFRSFDPRTGTYINRYGEERVCPYLR